MVDIWNRLIRRQKRPLQSLEPKAQGVRFRWLELVRRATPCWLRRKKRI